MNFSRTFILRPVATTLLMVAIILAGFVAYRELAVSALPTVDYPRASWNDSSAAAVSPEES